MKEMISLCGDNCLKCPRYTSKTHEQLQHTAKLWYKIGWRKNILPDEEIKCSGCSPEKECSYGLIECTQIHGVQKCSRCHHFPCKRINNMLRRSDVYEEHCKNLCHPIDFAVLKEAFFEKRKNL